MEPTTPARSIDRPAPRDWWRALRDGPPELGTSGAAGGTSGARTWRGLRAWAAVAALIAIVDVVNVFTALDDAARQGRSLAAWEPITWEATSGVAALIACPIIYAALRAAAPGRRPWSGVLLAHAGATLAFSAVHVGLMMAMRVAIYGALGFHYRVALREAPYEYRKDLLAYLGLAALFYFLRARRPATTPAAPTPATFDIQDGARTLRVRVDEIVAVGSAGNYVEFRLADGRRPLMRATLRDLETQLVPQGFARTHRSWLVNARHVRGLEPAGSGDYVVRLQAGVDAPLSRRFPQALARLRGV